MQEEVEQKTLALSIRAARLSGEMLQKAMRVYLDSRKGKSREKVIPHGKQSIKQLMRQNTGVSSIEVNEGNIKSFETTAKKYGIDFALKKDSTQSPPRYLVFFKGRDADVMTAAFQEFSKKSLSAEKKPSVKRLLAVLKEKAAKSISHRQRDKIKDRGQER